MIKFTNEIALITAVSDLRMFLDNVKGFTALFWSINSRSAEEKSPSGPISIQQALMFLRSSAFNFSFELTSANKIFEFSSKIENFDEILKQADGMVFCRNELQWEIPSEKLMIAQKWAIQ